MTRQKITVILFIGVLGMLLIVNIAMSAEPTFGDDFSSGKDAAWIHDGAVWVVEKDQGELKYKGSNGRGLSLVKDLELQDCTVEADIKPVTWGADPFAGLIVRYVASGDYLSIWLNSGGVRLQEWGRGKGIVNHFDKGGENHPEGKVYHFKAEVIGKKVTIWIDDTQYAGGEYPLFVGDGKVGITVADTATVYFDNFELNQGLHKKAVQPSGKLAGVWGRIKTKEEI
jgi:hypothetical protein